MCWERSFFELTYSESATCWLSFRINVSLEFHRWFTKWAGFAASKIPTGHRSTFDVIVLMTPWIKLMWLNPIQLYRSKLEVDGCNTERFEPARSRTWCSGVFSSSRPQWWRLACTSIRSDGCMEGSKKGCWGLLEWFPNVPHRGAPFRVRLWTKVLTQNSRSFLRSTC